MKKSREKDNKVLLKIHTKCGQVFCNYVKKIANAKKKKKKAKSLNMNVVIYCFGVSLQLKNIF